MGEEKTVYDTVLRTVDSAFVVLGGKMKAVKTAVVARLLLDDSVRSRHAPESNAIEFYFLSFLIYTQQCLRPLRRNPRRRPRARLAIAADHEQVAMPARCVRGWVGYRTLSRGRLSVGVLAPCHGHSSSQCTYMHTNFALIVSGKFRGLRA